MTHPATLQLIEFLEAPDNQASDQVSLHLATCKKCRRVINELTLMMDLIAHTNGVGGQDNATEDGLDDGQELIIRYLEGESTDVECTELNKLIDNNPSALKYMMQYRLFKIDSATTESKKSDSLLRRYSTDLMRWLKNRPMLGWQTVPAALALAYLTSTFFIASEQNIPISMVVGFQDNPVLTKTDLNSKTPGIGFFNQANTIEQPYGKVQIKEVAESLIITWPVIRKVKQYTFSLWKSSDKQMIVAKKVVSGNAISIESRLLTKGVSYHWEITANTDDGYHVATEGGIARN